MIGVMLLGPGLKILGAVLVWRVFCWTLGDIVMEHLGVPFLDSRRRDRV